MNALMQSTFRSLAVITFALTLVCAPAKAIESGDMMVDWINEPWFGDFSAMKKEGMIRILIPYSITNYYIDNGKEKGITFELMREFEDTLNKGVKKEMDKIEIVLIPTRRDRLISGLVEGNGEIAAANLTITPERLDKVDFSDPLLSGVRELVITSKEAPDYASLNDLSGSEIHVRESSSYFASLVVLNEKLKADGLDPVTVVTADERLEDEDLLELVHTGVIPAIVMDEHKAKLWLELFDNVKTQDAVPVREGGEIAWAFRKDSPELKKVVNQFVAESKSGTMLGNILTKRYYSDVNSMINPKTDAYQKKLDDLITLFRKYGEKYDIDPMLLAAQAFQESKFNQKAESRVGAVGIMQLLPSTASDKNVNIKNINKLENNIEAGAKYMRFTADRYFGDADIPELDKILFVFASYNAGPNRVAKLRKKADDPNKWFQSVEWQVARAVGTEPIKYVKNIYIYYLIFRNLTEADEERRLQKGQ